MCKEWSKAYTEPKDTFQKAQRQKYMTARAPTVGSLEEPVEEIFSSQVKEESGE